MGAVVTALPCHVPSCARGVHRTLKSTEPGHSFNLEAFAPSHPLNTGFLARLQPAGRSTRGHRETPVSLFSQADADQEPLGR